MHPEEEVSLKWYLEVLKKFAVLSCRVRRKEYRVFHLFCLIIAAALGIFLGHMEEFIGFTITLRYGIQFI